MMGKTSKEECTARGHEGQRRKNIGSRQDRRAVAVDATAQQAPQKHPAAKLGVALPGKFWPRLKTHNAIPAPRG